MHMERDFGKSQSGNNKIQTPSITTHRKLYTCLEGIKGLDAAFDILCRKKSTLLC